MLRDDDITVRLAAVATIGELGDPRAIAPLVTALKEDDLFCKDSGETVRVSAALALAKLGSPEALATLRDLFDDQSTAPPSRVAARTAAAAALAKLGDARARSVVEVETDRDVEREEEDAVAAVRIDARYRLAELFPDD